MKEIIEKLKLYGITGIELVHFLAQCDHESGGFKITSENLNYSAEGLVKVFPRYFKTIDSTKGYVKNPVLIANRVYGSRMGNSDELSGDGYKFRGRGYIQLTGKSNYISFFNWLKQPFTDANIDLVSSKYALESAIWFWKSNNLGKLCVDYSEDTVKTLTKRINGGQNGLIHRIQLTNKYKPYGDNN